MILIETVEDMKKYAAEAKSAGKTIGLVPTMGYLHEGHQSLIKRSAAENDVTVVSVFVNPIQFGIGEDLETYPRDLSRDMAKAEEAGATALFHPQVSDMYPEGYNSFVEVEGITGLLCGKSRPTHFRGVTTVVCKLFNISRADNAYFGQKDAQQLAVIKRMVCDLNMNINITGCPIVREPDGLAMSSRNTYLSPEEREQALVLSQSLKLTEDMYARGERDAETIKKAVRERISGSDMADIDYVEAYTFPELKECSKIDSATLVAVAVKFGSTRLIDNTILGM